MNLCLSDIYRNFTRGIAVSSALLLAACAATPPAATTVSQPVKSPEAKQATLQPQRSVEAASTILFEKYYTPPFVSETKLLPARGPINYERRSVNPQKYKIRMKRDISPVSGTLEVFLKRLPIPAELPQQGEWDTIVAFADAGGSGIMSLHVVWGAEAGPEGKLHDGIFIEPYRAMPANVWGYWYPFPEEIKVGDSYKVAISWGEKGNRLFFNDKLVEGYTSGKETEVVSGQEVPFGNYLNKATLMMIGNDAYKGDNSPLDTNEMSIFTIFLEQQ